jgi:hypothetical protein
LRLNDARDDGRATTNCGCDFLHGIVRSHEYDVRHERRILFRIPEYWIISDTLISTSQHDYDLLFHLSAEVYGHTHVTSNEGCLTVTSPGLLLVQPRRESVEVNIDGGCISTSYGRKSPAPIVRFRQRARDACFHTNLYPYRGNRPPKIHVESIAGPRDSRRPPEAESFALRIHIEHDHPMAVDNHCCQAGRGVSFVRTDHHGQELFRYELPDTGEYDPTEAMPS